MSSTRHAKDDSSFHQNSFASSPGFERGLLANLVAKRCSILNDKADRELIWFIQYLSHQPGGLAAVADDLLKKFPDRLGTPAMVKLAGRRKADFCAAEVVAIRSQIPRDLRKMFPLQGETKTELLKIAGNMADRLLRQGNRYGELDELANAEFDDKAAIEAKHAAKREAAATLERDEANKNPSTYPVVRFLELCLSAAKEDDSNRANIFPLEYEISRLCLDPGLDLDSCSPWYFSDLVNVLREYHQHWVQGKSNVVTTGLGTMICDALDFTLDSGSMSLLEGNARMGKSFAARAWCEQHPGKARFVQVSTGNDETSFLRDIARGLGLGNFINYKTVQIRERVESVLRTGDILLVLDEAQRLWPQRNLRYGYPGRVVWVMAMRDAGVPICLIATNQFIQIQKAVEKSGWNAAQFTGRIGRYDSLPHELSEADLIAVGRSVLPEANKDALKALAIYARASSRYLAAIEAVSQSARYIAKRNRRTECTTADIQEAMTGSVIPSDSRLLKNLEQAKHVTRRPVNPEPQPATKMPARSTRPAVPVVTDFQRNAGNLSELSKH